MKWSRLVMSLAVCGQSFHQTVRADTLFPEATAAQQWCHQVQHCVLAEFPLLNEKIFSFTASPAMAEQARKKRLRVTSLEPAEWMFLLQPYVPLFNIKLQECCTVYLTAAAAAVVVGLVVQWKSDSFKYLQCCQKHKYIDHFWYGTILLLHSINTST